MKKRTYKHFHEGDFKRILKLVSENYFNNALVQFEDYFTKYPYDWNAHVYYANLLIKMDKLKEAQDILDNIDTTQFKIKKEMTLSDMLVIQIKLYSCLKKYESAYELLLSNMEILNRRNMDMRPIELFFRKKLNILNDEDLMETGYLKSQIVNYNDEKTLEHLIKHKYGVDNDNPCQFFENFPLEEIYYQIKNMISEEHTNKVYNSIIDTTYLFEYDWNGTVYRKNVDYIEAVVMNHSTDIITLYPYRNRERRESIDLTPKLMEESPKVKKLSQIEKFNQRYAKKK